MRRASKTFLVLIIAAIALVPAGVLAQETPGALAPHPAGRGGTWEVSLPINFAQSATIDGKNGSHAEVNAGTGFGFWAGYNFNEHFQLNGSLTWNTRSFDATIVQGGIVTRQYSNFMNTSMLMANGVFYLMKGDLSPFVSAGVGIAKVDANIEGGAGSGPGPYVPAKTENDMAYSAGIGVRYEFSRQFSMQGSYSKAWIDMSQASGMPDFSVWRMDFIFPI